MQPGLSECREGVIASGGRRGTTANARTCPLASDGVWRDPSAERGVHSKVQVTAIKASVTIIIRFGMLIDFCTIDPYREGELRARRAKERTPVIASRVDGISRAGTLLGMVAW